MRLTRRELGMTLAGALAARGMKAATPDMDATLRNGIARRKIPAAVGMVATGNRILYAGAFGTRDASGVPVRIDSIFSIASMTKAITTVAALQLVEKGTLPLDEPVSKHLPRLANLQVLDGFDSSGAAKFRPAKVPVTLRHLLTHTSGFCYSVWDKDASRYNKSVNGKEPDLEPLMFEPGTRWQYGTGLDWTGRLIEAASGMSLEDYFQANICRPLNMPDTSFNVPSAKFDRFVTGYRRQPDGSLKPNQRRQPDIETEFNGGGGLYSTAGDYVKFMQMILNNGAGILGPKLVAKMETNQIGNLTAGKMKSFDLESSSDVDIQPGATEKWGFGFLINTTAYDGGRSAGSLAWAGMRNTYYWIDPKRSLSGVLMMQYLPFVDKEAVGLLGDFERAAYRLHA